MVDDERHFISVGTRIRHADRLSHFDAVEAADALQCRAHRFALPLELRRIAEMLQLTAAANAEDRTEWLGPRRRFAQDLERLGDGIPLLDLNNPHARTFERKRSEAENDDAAGSADALPVCEKIREIQLEFGAAAQRRGEFTRCVSARQAP